MKERIARFMQGRYGVDKLSQVMMGVALVCWVLSLITKWNIWSGLFFVLIIIVYVRMFSRNIPKRYAENQKFLVYYNKVAGKIQREKNLMKQRKTHHIYKCPSCKQKIRVPKGKGKISITCPKCRTEFIKRS
jgi:predicted membrane protein